MKKISQSLLFAIISITSLQLKAQPYLDLVNLRLTTSPPAGFINHNKEAIKLNYYNVSTNLPLVLKNKKDVFIFSPYFEKWDLRFNQSHHQYYGFILPVSFQKVIDSIWSLLLTGIVRKNDSFVGFSMKNQVGGAIITSYKFRPNATLKFGVYMNGEYFGLFVIPLLGIDWRIDKRNYLFGVLPGNITYLHTVSRNIGYGATFRAQTNSYNRDYSHYTRIDENQLGVYADLYLSRNIVFNAEFGHSFIRQVRIDKSSVCPSGCSLKKYFDYKVNDNLYLKFSMAYRLWL